jgi:hypothetical protein
MNQIVHGVIRGQTIELDRDLGLADGQAVTVTVVSKTASSAANGERRSAAGMLADYPEMDEYLEEIMRDRKLTSQRFVD